MITNCPHCKADLTYYDNIWHYTVQCDACSYDDMTKFSATYRMDNDELVSNVWWIDNFYIQISHENQVTRISEIKGCILFQSFSIPRVLDIDMDNPQKTGERIKTLWVFS